MRITGFFETNANTENAKRDFNRFIKASEILRNNVGEDFYNYLVNNWGKIHIGRNFIINVSKLSVEMQNKFAYDLRSEEKSACEVKKIYLNEIMKNNMNTKKENMKTFGININDIKHDLSFYYTIFTVKQTSTILKQYDSIEDYVNIMYFFKFIKKYNYNEISEKLGIGLTNIYKRYYELGWKNIGNFEENELQSKKSRLQLTSNKEKIMNISEDEIINILVERGKNKSNISEEINLIYNQKCRRDSYEPYGFKSKNQYINSLYYLVNVEEMTRNEIAEFFCIPGLTAYNKLRKLGLNKSLKKAQEIVIKRKRRSYQRINNSTKEAVYKKFVKDGLFGSISENHARSVFEYRLNEFIDINSYEYLVAVNTNNIIPPKQIDIPVVVIRKSDNKLFRFAIEYNGDAFHKGERDQKKEIELHEKNWVYMTLWEYGSTKVQKEFGSIDYQIDNVCQQIKEYIQ